MSGTRTHDELGRMLSETVNYGSFSLTYSMTYNANGTVDTFTDADGTTYRYLYDADFKPQGVIIPGVGTIAINEFAWLAPTRVSLPGGVNTTFQFTPLLEVSGIDVNDSANAAIADRSMTYDAARNLDSKSTDEGDETYSYDAVDRLTGALRSSASDTSYTYDGMGNRLTLDGGAVQWLYDDNNRLVSSHTATYEYDDNGNRIVKTEGGQVTRYFYDVANRLERVEDGSGTILAEYGYDMFSRRAWKELGGTRIYYLYSSAGLIGEYDATGAARRTYGYLPEGIWGTGPAYLKDGGEYPFYHNDHLGTPYMLTNQSGAVTWRSTSDPFGANQVTESTVENNFRLPGQYFDAETGLHYNYFRYYDPSTGRYLTSDPIGLAGGIITMPIAPSTRYSTPVLPPATKSWLPGNLF